MRARSAVAIVVMTLIAASTCPADEPEKPGLADGWKTAVPIGVPELGEGDQYVVWVEGGWVQVRREDSDGKALWHIVLARASDPTPPVVSAPKGSPRFEVSYRGGRYFAREDLNLLRALREPKPRADGARWPGIRLDQARYTFSGSAGSLDRPPKVGLWKDASHIVATSTVGPAESGIDVLITLAPLVPETEAGKTGGFGFLAVAHSGLRKSFYNDLWVLDDGELLVATWQRMADTGVKLQVGELAPAFSAKTLSGKPFRLEDYRGKYVLLDFWATWCGPCVAEIPHLREVYREFGKDDRLVMISLSLDAEIEAPKTFVAGKDTPWLQVFLGDFAESQVAKDYGADAIPLILLIGPDGKIVARDLRGAAIKEAVAKALARP